MNTYFNYKQSFSIARFQYTCKPTVDEREIHPYHEILYYIGGDATLLCESFSKKLSERSLIIIPKESYHFLKCDSPDQFRRLKISFTQIDGFENFISGIMSGIRIFDRLDERTAFLLESVCENLKSGNGSDGDEAFLSGALLMLLSTLAEGGQAVEHKTRDRLISAVLDHIDADLSKPLDCDSVADAVSVSPSTLSHTFKREMGISLHKYVTEKRMILAKRLIAGGNLPTKVFADCGFGDYSSFYKAYVRHFGHSPSES